MCPSCYRRQILEGSLKTRYVISTSLYSFQSWPSPRPISTAPLSTSLRLHSRPINLVVFEGPYLSPMGGLILEGASRLDAFSAYPVRTWLPSCATGVTTGAPSVRPPRSSRTRGSSPQTSCAHDNRTVSRRSEPSSRTALMGEQPNPWDRLQPQDAMSRHRGAKPLRRCELLGVISLLSLIPRVAFIR